MKLLDAFFSDISFKFYIISQVISEFFLMFVNYVRLCWFFTCFHLKKEKKFYIVAFIVICWYFNICLQCNFGTHFMTLYITFSAYTSSSPSWNCFERCRLLFRFICIFYLYTFVISAASLNLRNCLMLICGL